MSEEEVGARSGLTGGGGGWLGGLFTGGLEPGLRTGFISVGFGIVGPSGGFGMALLMVVGWMLPEEPDA